MPRNSSGVYTLPAGNPVVSGTVISSSWANTTLSDLATAITNSLSRDNEGGMNAPLELFAGAIGAPGLSWTTETTSGLYRAGAGDFRYSISSTDVLQLVANSARFRDGNADSTPGISFISDTNTGFRRTGADAVAWITGGAQRVTVSSGGHVVVVAPSTSATAFTVHNASSGPTATMVVDTPFGSLAANPTLTLRSVDVSLSGFAVLSICGGGQTPGTDDLSIFQNGSTGDSKMMIRGAASNGNLSLGTRAVDRFTITADGGTFTAGSGYSYTGVMTLGVDNDSTVDGDTSRLAASAGTSNVALYAVNANQTVAIITGGPTGAQAVLRTLGNYPIVFGTNNTYRGRVDNGGQLVWQVGSVGSPSYAFEGDVDTGIYRFAADELGFACGGLLGMQLTSGQIIGGGSGTAGAPRFTFFGDEDIGMYRVSSNVLGFSTNGTLRFQIGSPSAIQFPTLATTASAANAFLDSGASNNLLRSTSSLRYKTDVMDFTEDKLEILLKLRPVTYKSLCPDDDKNLRWYGFIAEEVAEVEPRLVHYAKDEEGNPIPDGVQYDRIIVPLVAYIQRLEARVKSLEKKVK